MAGIFCGIGEMHYLAWGEAIKHCGAKSLEARAAKLEHDDHIRHCLLCQAGRKAITSGVGNIRECKEWPAVEALLKEENV